MSRKTHNLGLNGQGEQVFVQTGEGGLRLVAGKTQIYLTAEQEKLLKGLLP